MAITVSPSLHFRRITMTIDTMFPIDNSSKKHKPVRIKTIKAVYETLTIREELTEYLKPGDRYTAPEQVFNTFRWLQNETKEYFISLFLDGKNRIAAIEIVSIGSLNQSIVHPREVFKTALLTSAAAIILLHNHPSGDPSPSHEDIAITKRLKEVGDLVGIRVLDHCVIGETYLSFVERGLL